MTVEEMIQFRGFVESFIRILNFEYKHLTSTIKWRREKASVHVEFTLKHLRSMVQHYVRKFCNEPAIQVNRTFLNIIRADILLKAREYVDIPIAKVYAKLLKTPMQKKRRR